MSQYLSLFVSTLALSATTAVVLGQKNHGGHHHHHHHHAQCPQETIIGTSCTSINNPKLVCQTLTSDASSAVECDGNVWVAHNGLVGEAFTDPPPAPLDTKTAAESSGTARIMTITPSSDRYLSQVYAGDMDEDSAAAATGNFIGSSFIGFAVTVGVGVVALL